MSDGIDQGRPFAELMDSGVLWLINRVVFHPRGYRLALNVTGLGGPDSEVTGWAIEGDGTEPSWYAEADDLAKFAAVEQTLREAGA